MSNKNSTMATTTKKSETFATYTLTPVENLACSLVASCVAETVTYPLEVAKVRLQIQGERPLMPGEMAYRNLFDAMYKVARHEHPIKLMAGLPAGLLRHSIAGTLRLGLYDPAINLQLYGQTKAPSRIGDRKRASLGQRMLASSMTGAFAMVMANPAELVKTKLQALGKLPPGATAPFQGTFGCFRHILQTEGFKGLFRGLSAAVPRMAWQNMAEMTAYDLTKDLLKDNFGMKDGFPLFFLGSLSAGFFGAYLGNPLDCVKTRIYNNPIGADGKPLYKGPVDCAMKMLRNEGILSFWKGVVPLWFHVSAFSIAVFVTYDMMRLWVRKSKARASGDVE